MTPCSANIPDDIHRHLVEIMRPEFIPTWWVTPNDGLNGKSPEQTLAEGRQDLLYRCVFYLGSGVPA